VKVARECGVEVGGHYLPGALPEDFCHLGEALPLEEDGAVEKELGLFGQFVEKGGFALGASSDEGSELHQDFELFVFHVRSTSLAMRAASLVNNRGT
jgi:hypothetical protein